MDFIKLVLFFALFSSSVLEADDTAIREKEALQYLTIGQQARYKVHQNIERVMAKGEVANDFYGIVGLIHRYKSEADPKALDELVMVLDEHPQSRVWPLRELPVNANTVPEFISWAKDGEVIAVIKLAAISKDTDLEASVLQSVEETLSQLSSKTEDVDDKHGLFLVRSARVSLRALQQNGTMPANAENQIFLVSLHGQAEQTGNYYMRSSEMNFHELMAQAGGPTKYARFANEVWLTRSGAVKDRELIRMDIFKMMDEGEDSELNFDLMENDVIFIQERYY